MCTNFNLNLHSLGIFCCSKYKYKKRYVHIRKQYFTSEATVFFTIQSEYLKAISTVSIYSCTSHWFYLLSWCCGTFRFLYENLKIAMINILWVFVSYLVSCVWCPGGHWSGGGREELQLDSRQVLLGSDTLPLVSFTETLLRTFWEPYILPASTTIQCTWIDPLWHAGEKKQAQHF